VSAITQKEGKGGALNNTPFWLKAKAGAASSKSKSF
jgi:hypothetical protein